MSNMRKRKATAQAAGLNTKQPDLSIVITSWNTRQILHNALASVFDNKGLLTLQVIVIDNASEDGSAAMVAADFPQVTLIRNTENRGFAAANNQGFEIVVGRYILMLNSDTIILGDVLSASVAYLEAKTSVGAMGCRVLNEDKTMQATCSMFPSLINLALLTSGLWKWPRPLFLGRYHMTDWPRNSERSVEVISGCYLMFRHEILKNVGSLDESFFFFGEETDFCHRIRASGWRIRFAPVGEIIHYGGSSAKRLNHRRDRMLTSSLVRLNRKHGGPLKGAIAWLTLLGFNVTRAAFWSLRGLTNGAARHRARHFRGVVLALFGYD